MSSISIEIRDQNVLVVNDLPLWADVLPVPEDLERCVVSPSELGAILHMGGAAIRGALDERYEHNVKELAPKGYKVDRRPSLVVAQLSDIDTTRREVYTEKGWQNGGVHYDRDELHDPFRGHWGAVSEAGFYPNVRVMSGANAGVWLLLDNVEKNV